MFVVLIGSVAKKEYFRDSDIDICRIETDIEVERKELWPEGPISYIDYTYDDFMKLYEQGSLFLYHIINEGILLHGDVNEWDKLQSEFEFVDNYGNEVENLKEIILDFLDIDLYGGTYLAYYSNLHTNLKNYSIFKLAHEGEFVFNKKVAFEKVFGEKYYNVLYNSYKTFARGISDTNLSFDLQNIVYANEITNYFKEIIK